MDYAVYALVVVLGTICFPLMLKPYLHSLQLGGYQEKSIFTSKRFLPAFTVSAAISLVFFVIYLVFIPVSDKRAWGVAISVLFFLCVAAEIFSINRFKAKKPLVYTKRVKRLLTINTLTVFCVYLLSAALCDVNSVEGYYLIALPFAVQFLAPFIFALTALIVRPFEEANKKRYYKKVSRVFGDNKSLIKIAITGSYGKTSVKNYLAAMLSKKYSVLMTKESYNTPLGMAYMTKEYKGEQVFIVEMGARHVGDVEFLMKLIKPDHAILTGITKQHLETFKCIENIIDEKYKVFGVGGVKVAPSGCRYIKREKGVLYAGFMPDDFCSLDSVDTRADGSDFIMRLDNHTLVLKTRLLGRHNLQNLALAAVMAYKLGVDIGDIEDAIENMESVPHRLQLIKSGRINIIDDTFNGNPEGMKAALEVLKSSEGRKVVLTPGLVELGDEECRQNFLLGERIGMAADIAILIGAKRAAIIKDGLTEAGMKPECVFVFDKLCTAKDSFASILKSGDTLLMLNDLPDNY